MNFSFRYGRLFLERSKDERDPILKRLSKIEGQVRGLRQMLEDDRYCLEEVQQANAITSGVREVALLIMEQHLSAGLEFAVISQNIPGVLEDLMTILRAAMKTNRWCEPVCCGATKAEMQFDQGIAKSPIRFKDSTISYNRNLKDRRRN